MFIDMVHELIRMQVPGAGPLLGQLRVPDISYADDVTLIAYDDPDQAQRLLDCLSIFSAIFKMEVNQHETKTCAFVFRCQNSRIPADIVLTYGGDVVPFKECYQCLGVVLCCMPPKKCMSLLRRWLRRAVGRCMLCWGDAGNNVSHSLTSSAGFLTF
jgi:hypothetical protein